MADPNSVEIPQPMGSGATDHPDAPQSGTPQTPPLPEGATSEAPTAPPLPAGASSEKPSTENGQFDENLGQPLENQAALGVGKGLMSTVEGLGQLIKKSPQVALAEKLTGHEIIPQSGLNAEGTMTHPQGAAQMIGYGGENLMEFLMGDEALKGMSFAEKASQVAGISKILEKSPRLMKMLQMGVDVGKAATELGPEEQAALKKSPMLARLVGAGMDAIRAGVTQGAQTAVKTGGDVKEAATQGAETAASAGVLGGAFSTLGRVAEKAGEAGKAVEEASAVGKAAPTAKDIGETVKNQIDTAEQQMHGDFETGIQKLKGDLGDQKVPYQGSPLQKAATEAMEGRADVPSQKTTTLGTAFQGIEGGSDKTLKMLTDMTQPNKTGDLQIDELVQRRQQLGKAISNILKGSTSSEDRADVAVYQKLRDGIDDTIDLLAKSSGKPEASQDYEALRATYKDRVKLFNTPVIRELSAPGVASETKLDSVKNYLLKGGNKIDKVNTLGSVLGDDGLKELGKNLTAHAFTDASSESGQINPAKFVKNFKEIDNLPPEVKEKLFDMDAANEGLTKLSGDLKSAANYQKLVRGGILSAAGASGGAVHPALGGLGLMLGLAGSGDIPAATAMLDKIANSPKLWGAFRTAGKIGATLEPVARKATPALGYGAGNALSNIVSGASQPLSQPDEDQDRVVYTNQ